LLDWSVNWLGGSNPRVEREQVEVLREAYCLCSVVVTFRGCIIYKSEVESVQIFYIDEMIELIQELK
jgi:hypothetical protein